jgi:tetratricopeptide (TPR) repeat protein
LAACHFGVFYFFYSQSENRHKNLIPLILDVFLPVLGFSVLSIFLLLTKLVKSTPTDRRFEDEPELQDKFFQDYMKNTDYKLKQQSIGDHEEDLREDIDIFPFIDLLDYGDLNTRKDAISKSIERKDRNLVLFLRYALESDNYEIKYLAKNNLEKIEGKIYSKIKNLTDALLRDPKNSDLYNERSRSYLDLCYFDLIDENLKDQFLDLALTDIFVSLKIVPLQSHLYLQVVRIYTKQRKYINAINYAYQFLDLDISEILVNKIKFYLAECYYELGKIKELKNILDEIPLETGQVLFMTESIEYWRTDHQEYRKIG